MSSVVPNASKPRTFSSRLGTAEIVLGVSCLGAECWFWLARGDALFTERYMTGASMAILCLILPGWWLRSSRPLRWLGQLLPLLTLTWLLLMAYAMSRW